MYVHNVAGCGRRGLGQYEWWYSSPPGGYTEPGQEEPPGEGDSGIPEDIASWMELTEEAQSLWERISGSSHCWRGYGNRPFKEPCPDTPSYDAIRRAVDRAPDAEIDTLVQYLLRGNDGRGPKNRQDLLRPNCIPFWTKAILGGKGCVNSRFPEAPEWFRAFVRTYGAPLTPQETQPGSSLPPASIPEGVVEAGKSLAPLIAAGLAVLLIPRMLGG